MWTSYFKVVSSRDGLSQDDTIMDGLQPNIKQENHNCIETLVKPIESSCTKPTELAGYCLNKEDHLQKGISWTWKHGKIKKKQREAFQLNKNRTEGCFKAHKQQNQQNITTSARPPCEPWNTQPGARMSEEIQGMSSLDKK